MTTREPSTAGRRLLRVGSVVGVPIFVTPSWVLVTAFITVSYSDLMRRQVDGASAAGGYLLALLFAVALAASILLHEVGHTVVSRALGLPVRRIVVFLLGGVSEIEGEPSRPRDEFSIAAAGPAVSFLLAGVCWAAGVLFTAHTAPAVMFGLLAWSNLVIAIFNVLPGLPLDGGRIVQSAVWGAGSSRLAGVRVGAWAGRVLAVLIAIGAVVAMSRQPDNADTGLGRIGATAAVFALSAFIFFGAGQALRQAEMLARAEQVQLRGLVRQAVYVAAQLPVSEALRQLHERGAGAIVVVDSLGRSRAIVSEARVRAMDAARQPWTAVAELATELTPGTILPEDLSGTALVERVSGSSASEYLVVGADGITRGVLAESDLRRLIVTHSVPGPRDGQPYSRSIAPTADGTRNL